MDKPAYDRADGIAPKLTTLEGLNNFVHERSEAGYDRHERMEIFAILGRWTADSCGNFGSLRISGGRAPKDHHPELPDVITMKELIDHIRVRNNGEEVSLTTTYDGGSLPPHNVTCPECQNGWAIENCHDAIVVQRTEVVPLDEFVSRTLAEVQEVYAQRTDAAWGMQDDILIRNDRYIDLSPKPGNETLKVNERGWVSKRDGILPEYVIRPGDDGHFNVWTFFHRACNRLKIERNERGQFAKVFADAGYEDVTLEPTPNQYCSCERCAPWYRVTTSLGVFTIGWRKRVINIDWSTLVGGHADLRHLFREEDVTKGATSIHAWGWEKATGYLSRIRGSLLALLT